MQDFRQIQGGLEKGSPDIAVRAGFFSYSLYRSAEILASVKGSNQGFALAFVLQGRWPEDNNLLFSACMCIPHLLEERYAN